MWVWGPLMFVPLILLFAAEVDSWPAVDTATETPWLPPSLCTLDGGRRYVSHYSLSPRRRQLLEAASAGVPSVLRADQEPAGSPRSPAAACPEGVDGPSALSFVLPEGMQGWPSLGSNVSLVIYHGEDSSFTLGALTLRDATGRWLLEQPSPTQLPAEAAPPETRPATSRRRLLHTHHRPGRELKGGGGGGGHGHRGGGHGGYTTAHRASTALPRYSLAPGTRTRTSYGMHARRAVATGTAVAIIVHHGNGCARATLLECARRRGSCLHSPAARHSPPLTPHTFTFTASHVRACRGHGYGRYYDMRGCGGPGGPRGRNETRRRGLERGCGGPGGPGGCTARVVEPLSREELTSAGTFVADASVAFPLTLTVASITAEGRAAKQVPSAGPPSLFFTLYSETGAATSVEGDGRAGSSRASDLRGLIWLPIWLALFSFLRLPSVRMDATHGMCTVLFVSTMACAAGYQVQLWMSGAW